MNDNSPMQEDTPWSHNPKPRPRREREREAHRREILTAAERVFAAKGYEAATVEEIAREAEFATGTLYNFFSGKEEMFLAVAGHILDIMIERFEREVAPWQDQPREAVTRYVSLRLDEIHRHEAFMHVFHPIYHQNRNGCQALPSEHEKFTSHVARVHAVFAEGIRQGVLHHEPSPDDMAGMVEGALRFLHHSWKRGGRAVTQHQQAEQLKTSLLPLLWAHPAIFTAPAKDLPQIK